MSPRGTPRVPSRLRAKRPVRPLAPPHASMRFLLLDAFPWDKEGLGFRVGTYIHTCIHTGCAGLTCVLGFDLDPFAGWLFSGAFLGSVYVDFIRVGGSWALLQHGSFLWKCLFSRSLYGRGSGLPRFGPMKKVAEARIAPQASLNPLHPTRNPTCPDLL